MAEVIRIMPLGDSITQGVGSPLGDGYRGLLWDLFQQSGTVVDFVGGGLNGPSSLPDRDHQGTSGERADELAPRIPDLMSTYMPDVVLLMIGTNDVEQEGLGQPLAAATLQGEISDILDRIAASQPNTAVFLSTLPPLGSGVNGSNSIPAVNDAVRTAAAQAVIKGQKVTLVEQNLTPADLADGVHPNSSGYAKLAHTWYDAVMFGLTGAPATVDTDDVFRFYNTKTKAHFYTNSVDERDLLVLNNNHFRYEGNAFDAAGVETGTEVFRFYNTKTKTHFYTASEAERADVLAHRPHFRDEGIAYFAFEDSAGGAHLPLYRFYNTKTHAHFYTASDVERQQVVEDRPHYRYEGIAYWIDVA